MKNFEQALVIGGISFYVFGKYSTRIIDDSFSHEFGVEKSSHDEVDSVNIEEVFILDDEGDSYEITPGESLRLVITKELKSIL